jgi:hypothetical protein
MIERKEQETEAFTKYKNKKKQVTEMQAMEYYKLTS